MAYYLEDFRRLAELDEKTLQDLLDRYPYAQNLHLIKSKWDWVHKHLFSESNAIYATQRERFFQQVESEAWEQFPDFKRPTISMPAPPKAREVDHIYEPTQALKPEYPDVEPVVETNSSIPVEDIKSQEQAEKNKSELSEWPILSEDSHVEIPTASRPDADQLNVAEEASNIKPDEQPDLEYSDLPSLVENIRTDEPSPEVTEEVIDLTAELFIEEDAATTPLAATEYELFTLGEQEPEEDEWPGVDLPTLTADEDLTLPSPATSENVWDLLEEPWTEEADRHAAESENQEEKNNLILDPQLPVPSSSYSQWLQRLSPVTPGIVQVFTPRPVVGPSVTENPLPNPTQQLKDAASASNIMRDHIASETLADILARQGYKERAISIYEKLILTNPEKSNFFAEKIKKLKGI